MGNGRNSVFIHIRLFVQQLTKRDFTHTHTHLTALCPGLPGWAGTRKVKPIWILLTQETVSGSGISWAICKSASCSRQVTLPAPNTQFFTGRMSFLPPIQQRQSTEGMGNSRNSVFMHIRLLVQQVTKRDFTMELK